MTHVETAQNVRATLARFAMSSDGRKLDPLPLLQLAKHGAEARGDFELAADIGVSVEVVEERSRRARGIASRHLLAAEACTDESDTTHPTMQAAVEEAVRQAGPGGTVTIHLPDEFPVSDDATLLAEGAALEEMAAEARAELEKAPDHEPLDPEESVLPQ